MKDLTSKSRSFIRKSVNRFRKDLIAFPDDGCGILRYIVRTGPSNSTNGRIVGGSKRVHDRFNTIKSDAKLAQDRFPKAQRPLRHEGDHLRCAKLPQLVSLKQ